MSLSSDSLWKHSHNAAILFSVLIFTAAFLCRLLWQNDLVHVGDPVKLASAVSTFKITYDVGIFGTVWNSLLFISLLMLQRDTLRVTERTLFEIEKSAIQVGIVGNFLYLAACIALMSTLARKAADDSGSQRAGLGATAAMAGMAAAGAFWASVMDALHAQDSHHRRNVMSVSAAEQQAAEQKPLRVGDSTV